MIEGSQAFLQGEKYILGYIYLISKQHFHHYYLLQFADKAPNDNADNLPETGHPPQHYGSLRSRVIYC